MKKLITVICMTLFFFANNCYAKRTFPDLGGLIDISKPKSIKNQQFLLTNECSGSHFFLISFQELTRRCIRGRMWLEYFQITWQPENYFNTELDYSKKTFYWGHEYSSLNNMNSNQNQLIFILRNFKENLVRKLIAANKISRKNYNGLKAFQMIKEDILKDGLFTKEYFIRVRTFEKWNAKNRLLVTYQELVSDPVNTFEKVLDFLSDSKERLADYAANLEEIKQKALNYYDAHKTKSITKGKSFRFYRQNVPLKLLREIDSIVAKKYPIIWEKYLFKHAE